MKQRQAEGKSKFLKEVHQLYLLEEEKAGKRKRDEDQHSETDRHGSEYTGNKRPRTEDDESEIEYVDEHGKKRRAKRRSKNDLDGRDYKCSFCPKTYLSYPALYTHMKTKHSKGSDGQHLLLNSGRGRGRPKKNAGRVTTIDPESDDYFKTLDKGGGPTDPLYYFDKIIYDFFSENSFARRNKDDNMTDNRFETPDAKREESKAGESMPPPPPLSEEDKDNVNSDMKMEDQREEDKSQSETNAHNTFGDMKEEGEENKSESQYKRKDDSRKVIFKQFDFKTYNDYKQYPLYHTLSKKRLFDNMPEGDVKLETKEEHSESMREVKEEHSDADEDADHSDHSDDDHEDPSDDEDHEDNDDQDDQDESKHETSHDVVKGDIKSSVKEEQSEAQDNEDKSMADNSRMSDDDGTDRKSHDASDTKEIRYGKKRFDQVLEDYENLTFEERRKLT